MRYRVVLAAQEPMRPIIVSGVYQTSVSDRGTLFFKDSSLKIIASFAHGSWLYIEKE